MILTTHGFKSIPSCSEGRDPLETALPLPGCEAGLELAVVSLGAC